MPLLETSLIKQNQNFQLEPFQSRGVEKVYNAIREGKKRILLGSPGGSGKTVLASKFAYDYITSTTKDVAIFVHRKELLNHARKELHDIFNIYSQKIDAKTTDIQSDMRVFVIMVETFSRRSDIDDFLKKFNNVGLCMFDEAHLNNFLKVFQYFQEPCLRIGFTATPISAKKSEPLNKYYDCYIEIAKISELVELNKEKPTRGIVSCENHDWIIDIGIKKENLKKKRNGEYDENVSGKEFGKAQQIQNTIKAYKTHCLGKKTLIFNSSIEHSLKMHKALLEAGYNSQHIDSDTKSKYSSLANREFIFGDGGNKKGWIDTTPDAILCNVGIASIGTDIKSVQCVIVNTRIGSFTKFWQIAFRGNRAYVSHEGDIKTYFGFLDLGGNMLPLDKGGEGHGVYWDDNNFQWDFMFNNPNLPRPKEGISPIKCCPACGAINAVQARICLAKVLSNSDLDGEGCESECGFIFPINDGGYGEDLEDREMIRVSELIKLKVSVSKNIEYAQMAGKREGSVVYETIKQVVNLFRLEKETNRYLSTIEISEEEYEKVLNVAKVKVSEYFKLTNHKKWGNLNELIEKEVKSKMNDCGIVISGVEVLEEVNTID